MNKIETFDLEKFTNMRYGCVRLIAAKERKKKPPISQKRDYFYTFLPSILAICKTCRLKHADQRKRAMDNVCISWWIKMDFERKKV